MSKANLVINSKRISIAVALLSVFALITAALLPSTELSITDSCQIDGPMQKLKSVAQGARFWDRQLQLLDETVGDLEAQPGKMRKAQQMAVEKTHEAIERARQSMEEIYSKLPELRPSPRQRIADSLREQADGIEFDEVLDKLEEINDKRIRILASCRPAILAATMAETTMSK